MRISCIGDMSLNKDYQVNEIAENSKLHEVHRVDEVAEMYTVTEQGLGRLRGT